MYQEERKHLLAVSKTCIAAGIEERRIRLAESQGQIIANVLREVLTKLNVLNLPQTPQIVRAALEQATGPAPAAMTAQTLEGTATEVGP
jgi:ribosome maturation protein Sdo1